MLLVGVGGVGGDATSVGSSAGGGSLANISRQRHRYIIRCGWW